MKFEKMKEIREEKEMKQRESGLIFLESSELHQHVCLCISFLKIK